MKLFSTSCETLLVGWDRPLLPRAAEILIERFGRGDRLDCDRLDFSSLICVLPSSRSTHRLDTLLARQAADAGLAYTPPTILTVGQLAERLYRPPMPLALEFEQTLAWARVLRHTHPDDLQPLIATVPPPDPIGPWLELAGTLRRLHEDLSANRLSFANVVEVAETPSEMQRWQLLCTLFDRYLAELAQAGLADPHRARRDAAINNRCGTDSTLVLIGTSDLSEALVDMLRSLNSELISIVAAPPDQASRFDEFGCVDTAAWVQHHLPADDTHWIAAGDIADQATAAAETLAQFAATYSADQVTVGVTDESHVGPLEVQLRGCGVSTYRHLGWTVSRTAVGRLLELTATHLQRRSWQSLAALVRHADVCQLATAALKQSDSAIWLTQLDQLLAAHFPIRVRDPLPGKALTDYPLAAALAKWVESWLQVFTAADQSIAQWSVVVQQWLAKVYAGKLVDADKLVEQGDDDTDAAVTTNDRTLMSLQAAQRMLERFAALNDELDLEVSGSAALEMLVGRLSDIRIVQPATATDVEILGWLELALDDAPAMVVVGVNHPFVPGAVTNDPFLPGSLRTRLRMADNDRRYARDVYALHLMLSTRRDVRLIVGRNAADGSPTPPSRLLAAAPAEEAARRVRQLLGGRRSKTEVAHRWDEWSNATGLAIPPLPIPADDSPVKTMSVTAFRDYLVCPYRFYLRHVLKLKPLDDASGELAANQFGDLVHGALERFGESPDRDETRVEKIEKMLLEHLHAYADEHYGESASIAVALQVVQAERRLRAVARAQADRAAAGWRIHASEASVSEREGAGITVDGKWMGLRGRFDRIDHHPQTGRWAILDYKTHGHKPEQKHLKKVDGVEQWIDLQLPLYRMMIPHLKIDTPPAEVELGYFNVSEKDNETRINIAQFSPSQMQQAEDLIHQCIRRIHAGDFEPTDDHVQFDDYGMILQTSVASGMLDSSDNGDQEGES